jgi:hypothetical protein
VCWICDGESTATENSDFWGKFEGEFEGDWIGDLSGDGACYCVV